MLGGKANLLAPPMFYCALGGSAVPRWAALLASKQAPHAAGPAVLRWCNVGLHTAFVSRSTHSHMIRICPLQLNPWSADSMTARMSTLSLCFLTYPHDRSVPCVQLNPWSADSDSDDDQAFDAAARRRSSAGECCLFVFKRGAGFSRPGGKLEGLYSQAGVLASRPATSSRGQSGAIMPAVDCNTGSHMGLVPAS